MDLPNLRERSINRERFLKLKPFGFKYQLHLTHWVHEIKQVT